MEENKGPLKREPDKSGHDLHSVALDRSNGISHVCFFRFCFLTVSSSPLGSNVSVIYNHLKKDYCNALFITMFFCILKAQASRL